MKIASRIPLTAILTLCFLSACSARPSEVQRLDEPPQPTVTAILSTSTATATQTPSPITPTIAPTLTPAPRHEPSSIAAGQGHTCLINLAGQTLCWGHNTFGTLGGKMDPAELAEGKPVHLASFDGKFTTISAGGYTTCAIDKQGTLFCWGRNDQGQLGDGTLQDRSTPKEVAGLPGKVRAVSLGAAHACAALEDGRVFCWGQNLKGELGNGDRQNSTTPVLVKGLPVKISSLAAGTEFSCGLSAAGSVYCWGDPIATGQPAGEARSDQAVPELVPGLDSVQAISAGSYHICAIINGGTVRCWGNHPPDPEPTAPLPISGITGPVQQVVAGADFSCTLSVSGSIQCWGNNYYGQLGIPVDQGDQSEPVIPSFPDLKPAVSLAAGVGHVCALLEDGSLKCWGDGSSGQLGDGTITWK